MNAILLICGHRIKLKILGKISEIQKQVKEQCNSKLQYCSARRCRVQALQCILDLCNSALVGSSAAKVILLGHNTILTAIQGGGRLRLQVM